MPIAANDLSGATPCAHAAFDAGLDQAFAALGRFGMDALVYDLAPVPFTPTGQIITPSIFGARNMPGDMENQWCAAGLYQQDPVQRLALRAVTPLYWSYHAEESSMLDDGAGGPVADYLRDYHLARGITVAVHTPQLGSATVTGIWRGPSSRDLQVDAVLAEFMFYAHGVHHTLASTMDPEALVTTAVRLTPRERECLNLCAEGLSDKQVAFRLDRSISTVVMHLQSAMRKLGARNRAQAIAQAAYYRLIH